MWKIKEDNKKKQSEKKKMVKEEMSKRTKVYKLRWFASLANLCPGFGESWGFLSSSLKMKNWLSVAVSNNYVRSLSAECHLSVVSKVGYLCCLYAGKQTFSYLHWWNWCLGN